jgi:hypothetical protein
LTASTTFSLSGICEICGICGDYLSPFCSSAFAQLVRRPTLGPVGIIRYDLTKDEPEPAGRSAGIESQCDIR